MSIQNTGEQDIRDIREAQSRFFASGATLDYQFRIAQLKRLLQAIQTWEKQLLEALWIDLHKSGQEALLTELSIVTGEIKNHIRHLKSWMKPKRVCTPLKMMPSNSRIMSEPLGNALIIAPWNYPVQLLLNPLVGAIAAGCTAVLKPSPYVPNVALALEKLIQETFSEEYIAVVQGHREVNSALLNQRYDIIFFTGSPELGRVVMRAAAENLTPVILELGGKSPVVVDKSANIDIAAKRIAWGKSLNAGQTCIAPDYLLIHREVKEQFIMAFKRAIVELHGEDVHKSKHYVRMVSARAFDRVSGYLKDGVIRHGGAIDAEDRYIEPTLLDNVAVDSAVMHEEIFGPVLPMIEIDNLDQAIEFVNNREKPLALYVFAEDKSAEHVLKYTTSGGGCINDVIMHIANEHMPFGGVGNSGMGRYHGRDSLYAFSHRRSILNTPTWLDLPFRYMPYKLFKSIKKLL